jgi:hypothetical protein
VKGGDSQDLNATGNETSRVEIGSQVGVKVRVTSNLQRSPAGGFSKTLLCMRGMHSRTRAHATCAHTNP